MAYPEFDGFSLQDDTFITSELVYRSIPNRSLNYDRITRRSGVKLYGHDFAERKVSLSGFIVAASNTDLRDKIDSFHNNVTRKDEGTLFVEDGRYATATVSSVSIADPFYAQDYVPFEIEFLLADPFFYGVQQIVTETVTSGTITKTFNITVSGSVYALPAITYYTPTATGYTTTSGVTATYGNTGEALTWSGTGATTTLAYSDSLTFDYNNQSVLEGSSSSDVEGVFARWEPGETAVTLTFSGTSQGGYINFVYQPRYL